MLLFAAIAEEERSSSGGGGGEEEEERRRRGGGGTHTHSYICLNRQWLKRRLQVASGDLLAAPRIQVGR